MAVEFGTPETEWQALYGLALIYQHQGLMDEHKSAILNVIEIIEKLRSQYLPEDLKISFLSNKNKPYEAAVLLSLSHTCQAFNYIEKAKSRVFVEALSRTAIHSNDGIPSALFQRENQLINELKTLHLKHRQNSKQQTYRWEVNIEHLESQLDELWSSIAQVGQKGAAYVELRRATPVEFAGTKQILNNL